MNYNSGSYNRNRPEILLNFLIEHTPKTTLEGLDLLEIHSDFPL